MNKTIIIEIRNVYGNQLMYVRSAEHAEAIQTLTRQKTVSRQQVEALQALGFEIIYI